MFKNPEFSIVVEIMCYKFAVSNKMKLFFSFVYLDKII